VGQLGREQQRRRGARRWRQSCGRPALRGGLHGGPVRSSHGWPQGRPQAPWPRHQVVQCGPGRQQAASCPAPARALARRRLPALQVREVEVVLKQYKGRLGSRHDFQVGLQRHWGERGCEHKPATLAGALVDW
jgi:hypothetical protein